MDENRIKFKKYRTVRRLRIGILWMLVIMYLLFIYSAIMDRPNLLVIFLFICMIFIVYKNKELRNISCDEMVSRDCDIELWKWYLENKAAKRYRIRLTGSLNHINVLNLMGEKEKAARYFEDLNFFTQHKKKDSLYVAYLVIANDYYFGVEEIDSLKQIRKQLLNQKLQKKKLQLAVENLAFVNNCYIHVLENDPSILAYIDRNLTENMSNLKKMKLLYTAYLLALQTENEELEQRYGDWLLKDGGTLYFVKEVRKIRKEKKHEKI